MATLAVVMAAAQVTVVVSTPGVPGPVLAWAALETPQACVFATTKVVTSSSGARATPLGPSAPKFESNIALNTPPTVISAATSNPSCSFKHGWFNNYPANLQAKQLAYVKANKTMVLFSPDCHPTVTLLSDNRHLIAPSVQSPAPGEL
jgi:hypothetical protein